jgi:hypothetical protein
MPRHAPDRDTPLKYRDLKSFLAHHGVAEIPRRGKGSHRMFMKVIEGRPVVDFVTCHHEGAEVSRKVVQHVREKFQISIENFYQ